MEFLAGRFATKASSLTQSISVKDTVFPKPLPKALLNASFVANRPGIKNLYKRQSKLVDRILTINEQHKFNQFNNEQRKMTQSISVKDTVFPKPLPKALLNASFVANRPAKNSIFR
jgi:phosphopantetheinyl transferase (holo-ACP synthase)